MDWVYGVLAGSLLANTALGILYGLAKSKAAERDILKVQLETVKAGLSTTTALLTKKETYVRNLEKQLVTRLPAGELADVLNGMFKAPASSGTARAKTNPGRPGAPKPGVR